MIEGNFAVDIFVTLFITINPIAVLATYLSITARYTPKQRKVILKQAIIFSFLVLVLTIYIGGYVLDILGLEKYALMISGGLLFCKFGWEALQNTPLAVHEEDTPTGMVPLGFPVIAGPGSITAIVLFTTISLPSEDHGEFKIILTLIVSVCIAITFFLLKYAEPITQRLGKNATVAIVRITGLLIVTLGIQLVLSGIGLWLHSV